jgi:hypothetical protein
MLCINFSFSQFGRNKAQYKEFKWQFIQTKHFDIYFYKGGEAVAEYSADIAEREYKKISENWNYKLKKRIPFFLYNSHNEFQSTLVISGGQIGESTGGVTTLLKNRITVPYDGSYKKLRHVLHHELTHGVMNDMFFDGSIQSVISRKVTQPPLWFAEGLAQWESSGWTPEMDMAIRDRVINNSLPPLQYLSYDPYNGGCSLFKFIAVKYGREKILSLTLDGATS